MHAPLVFLFCFFFFAAVGFHCCVWTFSSCRPWASHCSDLLQSTGSVVAALRLSCLATGAPGAGIEPRSPALAGGFLTTEPPRKSPLVFFALSHVLILNDCSCSHCYSSSISLQGKPPVNSWEIPSTSSYVLISSQLHVTKFQLKLAQVKGEVGVLLTEKSSSM